MIKSESQAQEDALLQVANLMVAAAKTAPKGCGADKLVVCILSGKEKEELSQEMVRIGKDTQRDFFLRDAGNVKAAHCIVLLGVKDIPLGLPSCGYCGFPNCGESKKAGSHCAFNVTDLGIALGSAVSIAADHRIDNRIMYSAGVGALSLNFLGPNVKIAYGVPLAVSSKSPFYDRDPNHVLL